MRVFGIIAVAIVALILLWAVTFVVGMCNDTAKVAKQEFSAGALLKKYESFKRMSAGIDNKRAMIDLYRGEIIEYYDSTGKLIDNDRDTRARLEQRKSELIGIISIHNNLCAQYNERMSEFNYRFTNRGDLPQSNLEPLPREYKPYILSLKNTK